MGMITGRTKDGMEFQIDERIKEDWRLVRAIGKADSENPVERMSGTIDVVNLMIGKDGENRLTEHIMERNGGFCPVDEVKRAILEILDSLKETKN